MMLNVLLERLLGPGDLIAAVELTLLMVVSAIAYWLVRGAVDQLRVVRGMDTLGSLSARPGAAAPERRGRGVRVSTGGSAGRTVEAALGRSMQDRPLY